MRILDSLFGKKTVNAEDLHDVGIVTHYKGKPFNGKGKSVHRHKDFGLIRIETTYKDGLKDGEQVAYYDNNKLFYFRTFLKDKPDGSLGFYQKSGEKFYMTTKESRERKTYIVRDGNLGMDLTEVPSVAEMLNLGESFYELSELDQIITIIEAFKKANNGQFFKTWIINEFRFMQYTFNEGFRQNFAEKIIKYYNGEITMPQLRNFYKKNNKSDKNSDNL